MKIDILSDLHSDNYFYNKYKEDDVIRFYSQIIDFNNCGDVLVIAGDLGHDNEQNIKILKILKQFYKSIICVLGNHDYYLIGKTNKKIFKTSFARDANMRELINSKDGMYCLNGNIIEIDGIKFGGCDSWYNDSYLKRNYSKTFTLEYINKLWNKNIDDSKFIFGIKNFNDIFEIEKPKIEAVYKNCDVMITHVSPSCKDEHISKKYQGSKTNTFFTFDA